jgi:hypothetical protein
MLANFQPADHMGPKAVVQAFVEAVNNQDWQAIEALVAANFARHSIAASEPRVHSRSDLIKSQVRDGEFQGTPLSQNQ